MFGLHFGGSAINSKPMRGLVWTKQVTTS